MRYEYLRERGALNETNDPSGSVPPRTERGAAWRGHPIAPEVLATIPESLIREARVVPIALEGETLTVATAEPDNIALADRLSFVTATSARLVPASEKEISGFLSRYFPERPDSDSEVSSMLQEFQTGGRRSLGAFAGAAPAGQGPVPGNLRSQGIPPGRSVASLEDSARTSRSAPAASQPGLDLNQPLGDSGVFTYVVEEGQRVLIRRPNGTIEIIVGPRRVWRGNNQFRAMKHFIAHPGDYLIVRYRNGRQEHLPGPSEVWLDPREHEEITREEALQVSAKEAVVVYSSKEGTSTVQRRVEYGPTLFIPRPGEWLHTFAWHSSKGGSKGAQKVPGGLVFQKLWLMPDQMYHDVPDVRTADDAVLTIRLMIFFELLQIDTMLETTHDPIGDFVNAATSDVVDFTGRHDFESFKRNTDKLNELETYRQLTGRAAQCGYRINKVVYRGYGAPERLQQMHDQAIEARTRLQLERATEQQAQDLENFKLESQMLRSGKRRNEQTSEVDHELVLARTKQEAELRDREQRQAFLRRQREQEVALQLRLREQRDSQKRAHLAALREMGVDLTAYLTQSRADRVIELRGPRGATHVHLDPSRHGDGATH